MAADTRARVAVVGVGQELRGDDAAGVEVARRLRRKRLPPEWLVVDAGPAPEICTSPLRAFGPEVVVIVDAAEMGEVAGAVRWLDWRRADGCGAGTHALPLSVVAGYLAAELGCQVWLLGIQPAQNALGTPSSPAVRDAVDDVVGMLAQAAQSAA